MTKRWACRLVNQPRGTQRYRRAQREYQDRLTQAIIALAKQYGRYGFPLVHTPGSLWARSSPALDAGTVFAGRSTPPASQTFVAAMWRV